MILEQLPLARQLDMVFKKLVGELSYLSSGTVFVQIRNNSIGKFGVKHNPIEGKDGMMSDQVGGLTEAQLLTFNKMALSALNLKKNWTHGEIYFDFTVRHSVLMTSIQFESNYNMASLVLELSQSRN